MRTCQLNWAFLSNLTTDITRMPFKSLTSSANLFCSWKTSWLTVVYSSCNIIWLGLNVCILLGYCAMSVHDSCPMFQDSMVVLSSRVKCTSIVIPHWEFDPWRGNYTWCAEMSGTSYPVTQTQYVRRAETYISALRKPNISYWLQSLALPCLKGNWKIRRFLSKKVNYFLITCDFIVLLWTTVWTV
jgi:hypothetical protein